MCKKISCNNCGMATWQGCGDHIEEALAGVAAEDRCTCRRDAHQSSAFAVRPAGQTFGGTSAGSW